MSPSVYADAARSQRGLELEDFCDAVLAEMLSHEATADDVAILCVERLAPAALLGRRQPTGR
jgi:hypothetical protein